MSLIQVMERDLKIVWQKSIGAKTEKERGELLAQYHKMYAALKKQRIQNEPKNQ